MTSTRTFLIAAAVVAGLVRASHAEDAAPAPAAKPGSDPDAAIQRAQELLEKVSSLYRAGKYAEATPLARESLALREQALGNEHPSVAVALNVVASLLQEQGAYAEARPLFERSLAILEKTRGKSDPQAAVGLNNLALLLCKQGAYAEARPLFDRALAIHEVVLGREHPQVAAILNNIALLLHDQGAYAEARPLFERSLAILEKTLGTDHPYVARSLQNLASLLYDQGAAAEARPLCERGLAITERVSGKEHPETAHALHNLASVLHDLEAYDEARPLYERALAIREKTNGKDDVSVASTLHNLAGLLRAEGKFAQARPSFERALRIYENALGGDHPVVADLLSDFAELLRIQGAFEAARPLFVRALAIREKALVGGHPLVVRSLHDLAVVLGNQGAASEARPLYERALALNEENVRRQLVALGPAQRLALVRSLRYRLDDWLLFSPKAGASGHAEALRYRGTVARAEAAERALARHATDEQRATLLSLQAATRLAAKFANQGTGERSPEARAAWQDRYARAAAERERTTRELASHVASARSALERLDLSEADVRKALPAGTALVELLRVRQRYLAWVVRATGDVARVEVGEAEAVERACGAFVGAIADDAGDATSREAIAGAGGELRTLVWSPIETALGEGVTRVVLCPDAALASVPFAALPGRAPGTVLGDDVALSHVFHPFDLVPSSEGPARGVGALVVGGVDYDRAAAGSEEVALPDPPALASLDRAPRGGSFQPIPGTRAEAEALRERFGGGQTTLLHGADATEARVRAGVKGKRFVHVATHGFARTDLLAGLYARHPERTLLSADAERQLAVGHDPMLLSGLALAGANPREGGRGDDGVLTALEASYLDLEGVDVVTLSACETARGTAESGEGVLGLVAAFQMGGARHVLASLWKVDDEATRRLMDGVYERMLRKESPLPPSDALREASRALRAWKDSATGKPRFAAARYWAAFVAYGG